MFNESYPDSGMYIDTPENGKMTELDINGLRAFYFKEEESTMISIYTTDRILTIVCSDTEFDLIEFAKSIKKR